MSESIGPVIKVTGEQEFKAAIAGINNEFKLLGSEMKLACSQFEKADKSTAALTAQNKVLGKEIDTAKGKISLLTAQYDKQNGGLATLKTKLDATKAAFSADSVEVAKAQAAYDKQNTAVIKLQTELNKAATGLNNMDRALAANNSNIALQNSNWTKLGQSLDTIGTKMKTVGAGLSSVGKSLAMTVTAPIVGLGVAAVKMASDLSENMNKIDVAFKGNAQEVKDWSGTTLSSFGISQGSALEMASLFGDMGTAMGQSTSEASKMSTGLVGLAGDLASFKNIGIAQAQDALKGIFTGEGESLKSLGIIMQDSTLIAYAQATGQTKLYSEMTQAEKVALRYAFVMDATKNSQGDFARTSEGTANQMRIFGEGMKELGANIGTYLLPVITPIIAKMTEWVKSFGALDEGTKKTILVVAGIAAVIGPLLVVTGSLITAFGTIAGVFSTASLAIAGAGGGVAALGLAFTAVTGPIGLAVLAIGGLVGGGIALYKNLSAEVIPAVDLFGGQVSEATQKAVTAYMDLNTKVGASLLSFQANNTLITSAIATETVATFATMGEQIKAGHDAHYNEDLATLTKFYTDQGIINSVDAQDVLSKMQGNHTSEGAELTEYEAQIKLIMDTAANDHRELTQKEVDDIKAIKDKMQGDAITALSASEKEQKVILERAKLEKTNISTLEASEVIKQSAKQRDETIAAANTQKAGVVDAIARQRAEGVPISDDQAATMIANAENTRSESVRKAEEMHTAVVGELGNQNADVLTKLNESDGTVKTWWQDLGGWFANNPIQRYINTISSGYEADPTGVTYPGFDIGGVFTRPTIIGVGEKRPEFVGALDDLKYIVRSEIERSGSKGQPAAAGVTVQNMYVRNDQDIKSVARELYNLQQQTSRGRGLVTT